MRTDSRRATLQELADNHAGLGESVRHVIVNGQLVLEDGKFTGAKPGRVLRGPGYKAMP